ncbi:hypothetical protein BCY91_06810 [Pelobium manganitolerans]|uniref:Uncharacterized protein n=1 Tax=Pelobium manganitolerans TaxID=1842495 RepID=A0A419S539_9SPHI|nr:AAA family ATPase [Pelobium manganitolerans]RKD15216.1 hypothetical protein BCY91_06810 [Pelobium manganitolerans]
MYLRQLKISGFRVFNSEFTVELTEGLNILVGENASGKSTIIDALRLVLLEDEYGKAGIADTDFHRSIVDPAKSKGVDRILFKCEFQLEGEHEQVSFLPWLSAANPNSALLNMAIENKEDGRGRFKRKTWGNDCESGLFEWELLSTISCIYLPPLRNAEEKLRAYKGSKLARLIKKLHPELGDGETHPLEAKISALNKEMLKDPSIQKANRIIQGNIVNAIGSIFGQDASLQFAEVSIDRIIEKIRLLFYPFLPKDGEQNNLNLFRELYENSLGYNNILYLATILAELEIDFDNDINHKVLLIEEPEAHLHPQLQLKLLQYLQEKAKESKIQIIVTTHSPTLTSSIDLHAIKVLSIPEVNDAPIFTTVANCGVSLQSKRFLERWLDITKSLLFFSKGILFVEGIAEAIVVKELAKTVLIKLNTELGHSKYHADLEEYGISIINLNGIYFNHFFSLFKGYIRLESGRFEPCESIPVRCAGITDNDPEKGSRPTSSNKVPGKNPQLWLVEELAGNSPNCRLFSNLKTFEYDLALEGNNLKIMSSALLQLIETDGIIKSTLLSYSKKEWIGVLENEKSDAAYYLLERIDKGKGQFAQELVNYITENDIKLSVPSYIEKAIKWIIDGRE